MRVRAAFPRYCTHVATSLAIVVYLTMAAVHMTEAFFATDHAKRKTHLFTSVIFAFHLTMAAYFARLMTYPKRLLSELQCWIFLE